jgi:hypothetical protein
MFFPYSGIQVDSHHQHRGTTDVSRLISVPHCFLDFPNDISQKRISKAVAMKHLYVLEREAGTKQYSLLSFLEYSQDQ